MGPLTADIVLMWIGGVLQVAIQGPLSRDGGPPGLPLRPGHPPASGVLHAATAVVLVVVLLIIALLTWENGRDKY